MPPVAFTSSAAILIPLVDEMSKLAVEPVSDIKTPILTLSFPLPCGWQALSKLAVTIRANRIRFIQVLTGLEVSDELLSDTGEEVKSSSFSLSAKHNLKVEL